MTSDDEWIENFYRDLEVGFTKYTRPADYKERALKVLNGQRNKVSNQYEGLKQKHSTGE